MKNGYFGKYGGTFVSPKLKAELEELERRKAEILYQLYIIQKYDLD